MPSEWEPGRSQSLLLYWPAIAQSSTPDSPEVQPDSPKDSPVSPEDLANAAPEAPEAPEASVSDTGTQESSVSGTEIQESSTPGSEASVTEDGNGEDREYSGANHRDSGDTSLEDLGDNAENTGDSSGDTTSLDTESADLENPDSPETPEDSEDTQPPSERATDLGESPVLDTTTPLPPRESVDPEVAAAEHRYQLLEQADQLYLGGQYEAATALYKEAKPAFHLDSEPEASPDAYPPAITDPAQLSPAGQVYWREYQAGLEKQLPTRIRVPLEFLADRYPEFLPGSLALADFLAAEADLPGAVAVLERAAARYPQEAPLIKALVDYQGQQEKWIEASLLARQFALFNPNHPEAEVFQQLADENLRQFQRQLRSKLVANTIANVFVGAAGYAITGGLLGPISAIQSGALLLQGESGVGRSVSKAIQSQVPLVEDEEVVSYVNDLGQRLAVVAGRQEFEYEFHVILEPDLNAFALPGGKVFVNAGAIAKTNSEAELAGLLAHEIAHAVLSHGFQLATEGNLLANISQYVPFGRTATNLIVLNYSRTMERQADELGTRILAASGYAADGVRNLMVTLEAEKEAEEDREEPIVWLSTHPATGERIENLERQIQEQGLNRYGFEGVIRHHAIQEKVKAMLAELEAEEELIEYDETLDPDP